MAQCYDFIERKAEALKCYAGGSALSAAFLLDRPCLCMCHSSAARLRALYLSHHGLLMRSQSFQWVIRHAFLAESVGCEPRGKGALVERLDVYYIMILQHIVSYCIILYHVV